VRGPSGVAVPVLGLLDTGADYSLFPISLASAFGIDLAAAEHIEGQSASGVADYYKWREPLGATVQEREVELSATFSNTPVVLLGRADFFVQFEAAFDQRGKRFTLKPY
jgi:hypothetical protein